jgi:hypothetical protein
MGAMGAMEILLMCWLRATQLQETDVFDCRLFQEELDTCVEDVVWEELMSGFKKHLVGNKVLIKRVLKALKENYAPNQVDTIKYPYWSFAGTELWMVRHCSAVKENSKRAFKEKRIYPDLANALDISEFVPGQAVPSRRPPPTLLRHSSLDDNTGEIQDPYASDEWTVEQIDGLDEIFRKVLSNLLANYGKEALDRDRDEAGRTGDPLFDSMRLELQEMRRDLSPLMVTNILNEFFFHHKIPSFLRLYSEKRREIVQRIKEWIDGELRRQG